MTQPDRTGLKPGHWLLIGLLVLVLAGVVTVILTRGDGDDSDAEPRPSATSASTSAGPSCLPTTAEIGYTVDNTRIDFGLIATSACPEAIVGTVVEVVALASDGSEITPSQDLQPQLPVLLPGQRLGTAGTLLFDSAAKVDRLEARYSGAQSVPVSTFAAWPRSVTVTDLKHTGPNDRGLSTITGTVRTDPDPATLCDPHFVLILRDKNNKIVYGETATANEPKFEEEFPAATDYDNTEVYVVQGAPGLGGAGSGTVAACQGR